MLQKMDIDKISAHSDIVSASNKEISKKDSKHIYNQQKPKFEDGVRDQNTNFKLLADLNKQYLDPMNQQQ